MKPLLVIAAIALGVLALSSLSEDSPSPAAVCPDCPGGVCPAPYDRDGSLGTLSLQERIVSPAKPEQELMILPLTLAKHEQEKSLIKPDPYHYNEGPDGWRLRLLYVKGDKQAEKTIRWLNSRMPFITKKFGFTAIPSSSDRFNVWREAGYPADKTTLILATPNNEIALRTTDIPKDIDELRLLIRTSAEKFQSQKK